MSMQNNLGQNTAVNGFYQLADSSVNFSRLSPKLGLNWALSESDHAFASYNQGFRTPSENQLFRSGATVASPASAAVALRPILAEQFELGIRGNTQRWSYELVLYQLNKQDDLLSQKDSNNVTIQTNNGSTQHQGVELGLGREMTSKLRLDLAASYAKHRYRQWSTSTANYSGNEIENAPRLLANLRLTWQPVANTQAQLEWVELGSYFLEASNQQGKYAGHRLFNARISTKLDQHWSCFARITNLTDKRYADSASYSSVWPCIHRPCPALSTWECNEHGEEILAKSASLAAVAATGLSQPSSTSISLRWRRALLSHQMVVLWWSVSTQGPCLSSAGRSTVNGVSASNWQLARIPLQRLATIVPRLLSD